MDPSPDARFEYLVGQIREAIEHTLLAREPAARGVERHLVGPEERFERVHAGAGVPWSHPTDGPGTAARDQRGGPTPMIAGSVIEGSNSGFQSASLAVWGLPSISALWIAVIGRQKFQ